MAKRTLVLADSFRGYTRLFSGDPKRSDILIDLIYDQPNTYLYEDVHNIRRNLESLMGSGVHVNVIGPEGRMGVNSALSNLAHVTQDYCHVVAIDEIWLHRLLGDEDSRADSGLIALSPPDLLTAYEHSLLRAVLANPQNLKSKHQTATQCAKYLVYNRYVTEALSFAYVKAGRPEALHALPYRHNWGVLAITQPNMPIFIRLCSACVQFSQTLKSDETDYGFVWWRLLGKVMDPRASFFGERHPDAELAKTMHKLIWGHSDGGYAEISWDEIIDFKRRIWNKTIPIWQNLTADLESTNAVGQGSHPLLALLHRHLRDFDDVYLFDFDRGTDESITAFFLELLLTHEDIEHIFIADSNKLLRFIVAKEGDQRKNTVKALTRTLLRLHQLLSRRQRQEIRQGTHPGTEAAMIGRREDEPPLSYALLSRQWLSTVPRIVSMQDIRNRIILLHLPYGKSGDSDDRLQKVITYPARETFKLPNANGKENPSQAGVPVSGMWYLGAMSGGNKELAADVVREILSDYHERDRMLTRCAAPVTHPFYDEVNQNTNEVNQNTNEVYQNTNEVNQNTNASLSAIPYARILADVYAKRRTKYNETSNGLKEGVVNKDVINPERLQRSDIGPVFPFTRSRIVAYTNTALLLIRMIKETMELPGEYMFSLYRRDVRNEQTAGGEQLRLADGIDLQLIVKAFLDGVSYIYQERDKYRAPSNRQESVGSL